MMNSHSQDECGGLCDSCSQQRSCSDPRAQGLTVKGIERIKHKILVGSGKGGVGKSTVAANLAVALMRRGYQVGLLDADITGPDIPKLLGIEDARLSGGPEGLQPASAMGIKVVSMALLLESRNSAVVWRGPMKMSALKQFIQETNWGDLDFLIVDLPPGTSDEPISTIQLIPEIDGAVVVTTPQEVALLDSRKAVAMFQMMNVPVLGIVENMSGLVCPHCGECIDVFNRGDGEKAARELGVDFLGCIPIESDIGKLGDQGVAFAGQGSAAGEAFEMMVAEILEKIICAGQKLECPALH